LYADYSDPDVIRVGEDYYMVASSFAYLPGVPFLHSKDLVHWEIIIYCVRSLPFEKYDRPSHGSGTWAPSIRHHEGTFYVFIPLPDEGIFVATSEDPYVEFKLHCLHEANGCIFSGKMRS
jgi:beta-xylosidase